MRIAGVPGVQFAGAMLAGGALALAAFGAARALKEDPVPPPPPIARPAAPGHARRVAQSPPVTPPVVRSPVAATKVVAPAIPPLPPNPVATVVSVAPSPAPKAPSPLPNAPPARARPGREGPPAPPPPPPRNPEREEPPPSSVPASMRGRVKSSSGNPFPPGLSVRAIGPFPKGTDRWNVRAKVEEDGSFCLERVWSGCTYIVAVFVPSADGHELARSGPFAAGSEGVVVTLAPGKRTHGSIQGRVLDAEGKPVGAGVRVGVDGEYGSHCGNRNLGHTGAAMTREDGTFVIEFLDYANFLVFASRDDEIASADLVPVGATDVVLRLGARSGESPEDRSRRERVRASYTPAATAVTGRLLPPEGTDLPKHCHLEFRSGGGSERLHVQPDRRGVFDTGTLAPGTYAIQVITESGLVIGERGEAQSGTRGVEIALEPHGCIEGQVFLPSGALAGADYRVTASSRTSREEPKRGFRSEALTRADGTFRIAYVGDYEFTLYVVPPMGVRGRVAAHEGLVSGIRSETRGVAVRMEELVDLDGTLVDAEGLPCVGWEIVATAARTGVQRLTKTDEKGRFEIRQVFPGRARVVAVPEARNSARKREVDLGEFEAPAENLRLQLPRE